MHLKRISKYWRVLDRNLMVHFRLAMRSIQFHIDSKKYERVAGSATSNCLYHTVLVYFALCFFRFCFLVMKNWLHINFLLCFLFLLRLLPAKCYGVLCNTENRIAEQTNTVAKSFLVLCFLFWIYEMGHRKQKWQLTMAITEKLIFEMAIYLVAMQKTLNGKRIARSKPCVS